MVESLVAAAAATVITVVALWLIWRVDQARLEDPQR